MKSILVFSTIDLFVFLVFLRALVLRPEVFALVEREVRVDALRGAFFAFFLGRGGRARPGCCSASATAPTASRI